MLHTIAFFGEQFGDQLLCDKMTIVVSDILVENDKVINGHSYIAVTFERGIQNPAKQLR